MADPDVAVADPDVAGRVGTGDLLAIGIGNDLRCDDGAGRLVAERVQELALAGVRVRSVCQLLPELIDDLATCARVVFVDADPDSLVVSVRPICASPASASPSPPAVESAESPTAHHARSHTTHHTTPVGLLRLAETAGVHVPAAFLISIPVCELGFGTWLSPQAAEGVVAAVDLVADLAGRRT